VVQRARLYLDNPAHKHLPPFMKIRRRWSRLALCLAGAAQYLLPTYRARHTRHRHETRFFSRGAGGPSRKGDERIDGTRIHGAPPFGNENGV